MTVQNLNTIDYQRLFPNADPFLLQEFFELLNTLTELTVILEGSGAPTFEANKHVQYFDTAASKYYRNTDGGTTWVALN